MSPLTSMVSLFATRVSGEVQEPAFAALFIISTAVLWYILSFGQNRTYRPVVLKPSSPLRNVAKKMREVTAQFAPHSQVAPLLRSCELLCNFRVTVAVSPEATTYGCNAPS